MLAPPGHGNMPRIGLSEHLHERPGPSSPISMQERLTMRLEKYNFKGGRALTRVIPSHRAEGMICEALEYEPRRGF